MKIQFIIPKQNRGWAYPLLKWRKNFEEKGVRVQILSQPDFTSNKKGDVVILTSRYYQPFFSGNTEYFLKGPARVRKDIAKLRDHNTRVVFYDLSDATGSRDLEIIKDVDLFWKRQLFKNRSLYLDKHPYRLWVKEKRIFRGCEHDDLLKLRLGWNLGYQDYNEWWFNNRLFKFPSFREPEYQVVGGDRKLTASFRGKMGGQTKEQRQAVKETIDELRTQAPEGFLTGGIIKKKFFLEEMKNTKAAVSPFGYGEICYRDIEAFITGAILVKPSMTHLETFPNFFKENETYLPVKWDLSDLKAQLSSIHENYNKFQIIAKTGQQFFREVYSDFEHFYQHFVRSLE